jgi:hypothetical protein
MNARKILKVLQGVEEVGYLTPTSDPPDILGVLMNSVREEKNDDIRVILDRMRLEFEINHRDVDDLLTVSEMHTSSESPGNRRLRLIDFLATHVEYQDKIEKGELKPKPVPSIFYSKGRYVPKKGKV